METMFALTCLYPTPLAEGPTKGSGTLSKVATRARWGLGARVCQAWQDENQPDGNGKGTPAVHVNASRRGSSSGTAATQETT